MEESSSSDSLLLLRQDWEGEAEEGEGANFTQGGRRPSTRPAEAVRSEGEKERRRSVRREQRREQRIVDRHLA